MNTMKPMKLASLAAITALIACGGSEPEGPCGEEPVAKAAEAPAADATAAAPASNLTSWTELDAAALTAYGERVYMAKGSNTCNDCHGKDGINGRLEQAADLTQPATWRVNKVYGDDAAKSAVALDYLISKGGKQFNENFEKDIAESGWDWAKAEATSYDIQMFGVTQSSTKAEIKKIRKALKKEGFELSKEDMTAFGTKSVIAYLDSIAAK